MVGRQNRPHRQIPPIDHPARESARETAIPARESLRLLDTRHLARGCANSYLDPPLNQGTRSVQPH